MMAKFEPKPYIVSFEFSIFTYLPITMVTPFKWKESVWVNWTNLDNYIVTLPLQKL